MENKAKNRTQEAMRFEKKMLERVLQYLTPDELAHAYFDYKVGDPKLIFDLYLEKGCVALGWPERTAIEIKYGLMPDTMYKMVSTPIMRETFQNPDILRKLVVIYKEADQAIDKPKESKVPGRVEIYSEIMLSRYIKLREKEGYITTIQKSQSSDARIVEIIEEKSPYVKDQEQLIQAAQNAFRNERVSIFLGAGVSVDAGLPKWDQLLEGMLKQKGRKPFSYISETDAKGILKACDNSSIVVGRYAYNGYGNMSRFSERIKDVLYENVHDSRLVETLCDVIVSTKGQKQISHIITYNYDDLIETGLDELNYHDYYSIYGKNRDATKHLPIYHVHGMISQREIYSTPILSEKDYHDLYKNNHNWANVVQLFSMNTTTCFFIGLSMNDPNLRRLLDFSRSDEGISRTDKEELPHYAFLRREALKEGAPQEVNEEHWSEVEIMMQEFGINVIWYNEFGKLPDLIRRIML